MTDCKRKGLLWLSPFLLGACMTVEMPKHMVADAVDASVKAYDSITGKPKDPAGFEFSYTALFDEAVSVKDATSQCYERVSQHARNEMKNSALLITPLGDSLKKRNKLFSIECRIRAAAV